MPWSASQRGVNDWCVGLLQEIRVNQLSYHKAAKRIIVTRVPTVLLFVHTVLLFSTRPRAEVCFDLLFTGDREILAAPYKQRRTLLERSVREIPGRLHVARAATGSNDDFLREAWSTTGCEGLMFKRLDAPYEPGRRSPHWLKFKPESTLPKDMIK